MSAAVTSDAGRSASAVPAWIAAFSPSISVASSVAPYCSFGLSFLRDDSTFPTYSRPLRPFLLLDPAKARLLPPPEDLVFSSEWEASQALTEYCYSQGYQLGSVIQKGAGRSFGCRVYSCPFKIRLEKRHKESCSVIVLNGRHNHTADLELGVDEWRRQLTDDECNWITHKKQGGHLTTTEEVRAGIEASRKRLHNDIPMPEPSAYDYIWCHWAVPPRTHKVRMLTPPPASAVHESSATARASELAPAASSLSCASLTSQVSSGATLAMSPSMQQEASAPSTPPAALLPTGDGNLRMAIAPVGTYDNNLINHALPTYNRPLAPFVVLDPAKARLLPAPKGGFRTRLEACHVVAQHAFEQGYELDFVDPRRLAGGVILPCKGNDCPYQATVKYAGPATWAVTDNEENHSHEVDLEIGVRRWSTKLTEEEERFIKTNKRSGRLFKTMEESQAVIEESRRRLHSDIPMPDASAYASLWRSRGRKRARVEPPESQASIATPAASATPLTPQLVATSSPTTTAVVVPTPAAPTAQLSASPAPLSPNTTSTNATVTTPSAPPAVSSANKDAFMRGLEEMVTRLWPEGIQNPQSKVRAAVKAMLIDDQEQQQPAL